MKEEKSTWKDWLRRIIMLLCIVVFCYSAFHIGQTFWHNYQQSKIREEVALVVPVPEDIETKKEFSVDWDKLKKINPDIVAYIVLPGTKIDYPVVYRKNDTNYYLRRDLHGNYSTPGSIFLDGDAAPNFSDRHTFVYGHNMLDGTMFGELKKLLKSDFFHKEKYVYLFTPEKNYRLDIIAIQYSPEDGEAYETVGLDTDEEMSVYLDKIKRNATFYRSDVDVSEKDSIISLSTCSGRNSSEGRHILHLKVSEWK